MEVGKLCATCASLILILDAAMAKEKVCVGVCACVFGEMQPAQSSNAQFQTDTQLMRR